MVLAGLGVATYARDSPEAPKFRICGAARDAANRAELCTLTTGASMSGPAARTFGRFGSARPCGQARAHPAGAGPWRRSVPSSSSAKRWATDEGGEGVASGTGDAAQAMGRSPSATAGCCQLEGKLPTAGAVMVARGRSDQCPCPHVGANGQLGQDAQRSARWRAWKCQGRVRQTVKAGVPASGRR